MSDVFSLGLVVIYFSTQKKFKTEQRARHLHNVYLLQEDLDLMISSIVNEDINRLATLATEIDPKKRMDFLQLQEAWNQMRFSKTMQTPLIQSEKVIDQPKRKKLNGFAQGLKLKVKQAVDLQ